MTLDELYRLWGKLIDLLEAGASVYDEEIDMLIDTIEDGLANLIKIESVGDLDKIPISR